MRRELGRRFDDGAERSNEGSRRAGWTAACSTTGDSFPEFPSRAAFHRSLATCIPSLRSLSRALTTNTADAADLVQETCLRALQHWQQIAVASIDDLKRWLRTVMRNLHCDRSQRRRRELSSAVLGDLVDESEVGPCQLWRLIEDEAVVDAVSALPSRLRSVYVLFSGGASYVTIANRLAIPENTVGTRISRARRRLRKALAEMVRQSPMLPVLRSRQLVELRAAS